MNQTPHIRIDLVTDSKELAIQNILLRGSQQGYIYHSVESSNVLTCAEATEQIITNYQDQINEYSSVKAILENYISFRISFFNDNERMGFALYADSFSPAFTEEEQIVEYYTKLFLILCQDYPIFKLEVIAE